MAVALGIIFAYGGWTGVVYFAGEVRDPGREIPRALVVGLLETIALYVLLNLAFLLVLPLIALALPSAPSSPTCCVRRASGSRSARMLVASHPTSRLIARRRT